MIQLCLQVFEETQTIPLSWWEHLQVPLCFHCRAVSLSQTWHESKVAEGFTCPEARATLQAKFINFTTESIYSVKKEAPCCGTAANTQTLWVPAESVHRTGIFGPDTRTSLAAAVTSCFQTNMQTTGSRRQQLCHPKRPHLEICLCCETKRRLLPGNSKTHPGFLGSWRDKGRLSQLSWLWKNPLSSWAPVKAVMVGKHQHYLQKVKVNGEWWSVRAACCQRDEEMLLSSSDCTVIRT